MEPEKKHISTGDSLRIDLFNGFKISDVPELRGFRIRYFTSGHKWGQHCTRYIQVYS